MFLQIDPIHTILDIITPVSLVGVTVVGLMIRSSMAELTTKHVEAAATVKAELLAYSTIVKEDLAVHTAEDRGQFQYIRDGQTETKEQIKIINQKLDMIQYTKH